MAVEQRKADRRANDRTISSGKSVPVKIVLESPALGDTDLRLAKSELKKGHNVLLTLPPQSTGKLPLKGSVAEAVKLAKNRKRWTATDVITVVSGGAALGIATLALAPASLPLAAVASAAGAVAGHFARMLDRDDESLTQKV